MGILDSFAEALQRARSSSELLLNVADQIPGTVKSRYRLHGASNDLIASAERAAQGFRNYLPWSLDEAFDEAIERAEYPLPNEVETAFTAEAQFRISELTPEEQVRFDRSRLMVDDSLRAVRRRWERQKASGTHELRQGAWNLLVADFKSFTFFCRAYQDSIYSALIEGRSQQSGVYTSMNKGLKSATQTESLLHDVVKNNPEYVVWFNDFRSFRDLVKLGVVSERSGSGFDVKVNLQEVRVSKSTYVAIGHKQLGFSDIVSAIGHSADMTVAIAKEITP